MSGNRLLAALPAYAAGRRSNANEVALRRGDVLIESGPDHGSVYFPHTGLVSLVVVLPEGTGAEAAVIGQEGLVGHPYLADFDAAPVRAVVQMDGRATRIPGEEFHAMLGIEQRARDVVANFARALLAQTLQTVACNSWHATDGRMAKRLLQCADRTEETVSLTHEVLAEMLALSRPTVSLTARTLQAAGLIRYSRGQVDIIDRRGLEDIACPCYRATRRVYEELLPPDLSPS